jgi:hypothetical protein
MPLTEHAQKRLAGLWGGYDFRLIRDSHVLNASEIADKFLERYEKIWRHSSKSVDKQFVENLKVIRATLARWAEQKLAVISEENSVATIRAQVMFKQIHYSQESMNFGSTGTNWKKKVEIARELDLYRPWSVEHAAAVFGGRSSLYKHMNAIVRREGSSSAPLFFEKWWKLTSEMDRPMLFPQVYGHTSGKMWSADLSFPIHFDFGLVNVVRKAKLLIECGSNRNRAEERERRQVAEENRWTVRHFEDSDINERAAETFESIKKYLSY